MKNNLPGKLSVCAFITMILSITITTAQWISKPAGFNSPQRGISQLIAVNKNVAWAVAYDGQCAFCTPINEFTRTTDGGQHWISGSITSFPDDYLLGLSPVSKHIAYALTTDADLTVNRILKTTDGGNTWDLQFTLNEGWILNDIHFFNAKDGLVYGGQINGYLKILTTHDGGQHWIQVPQANLPPVNATEEMFIFSGTAVGNTLWAISTDARVWKTTDKGLHWTVHATPATAEAAFADISNIKMRDQLHGLLGFHDQLYSTHNAGESWDQIITAGTWFTNGLGYVPGTAATWLSTGGDLNSSYGALHGIGSSYSNDDGRTWVTIDTAVNHLAVAMVAAHKGFSGGFNTGANNGMFLYAGPSLSDPCENKNNLYSEGQSFNKTAKQAGKLSAFSFANNAIDIPGSLIVIPNPVYNSTKITFNISNTQKVRLQIFDMNGRLIETIADKIFNEGTNECWWNAGNIGAGIYILKISSTHIQRSEKIVVIK